MKKFFVIIALILSIVLIAYSSQKLYFTIRTIQLRHADLYTLHQLNMQSKLPKEFGFLYNNFSFVFFDGLWNTLIQIKNKTYDIGLHFSPLEVEPIPMEGELNTSFDFFPYVYITFDPEIMANGNFTLATAELAINIARVINRKPIAACTRPEGEACTGRPIISCETNETQPIIYFKGDNTTYIKFENLCITLAGKGDDGIIKAANKLLYKWFNIIT